ncbi:MAG: TRAP transporter large permease [Sneathiellaceae bacterium]
MIATILVGLVLLFLILGVPIAVSLGLSSLLVMVVIQGQDPAKLALVFFGALEHYTLLAIPFFVLASSFMSTGGVARRIIRFAIATVGHFRGGMAMAGVFACMMFAALSGSSPATVVAIGTIAIAGMIQAGYTKEFAAGVICNAGTLGILIPPSIVMVVYAAATDVSVGRMFLAGVIPGLLAGLALMVAIYLMARYKKMPRQPRATWAEFSGAGGEASWGLLLIVVIFLGIYGLPGFLADALGIKGNAAFTPTEAAAVAAVYAFLIALFVYRDIGPMKGIPWRRPEENRVMAVVRGVWQVPLYLLPAVLHPDTRRTFTEAARVTLMLMFIIANALLFSHVLVDLRIPADITAVLGNSDLGPITFLILVNLLLLLGGQFMEPSGLLIIVAPVVFPIAMTLGIDPIHLGIIMVVNMEIGLITPPVGLNLFVTAGITRMSIMAVVKAAAPWLAILFGFLILVTYVPIISTFLPDTFLGPERVDLSIFGVKSPN